MAEVRRLRPAGRRSSNWNLRSEVRSRQTPMMISAPFGIIGAPGTGRKTLALRFAAMNADGDRLPREDGKSFFNSFHERSTRPYDTLRSVVVHLQAFIYPPPTVRGFPSLTYRVGNRNDFCCLVFLFDVSDRATFSCAKVLMRLNTRPRTTKFLVGNKCDRRLFYSDRRTVPRRDLNRFLSWRRIRYFEISARTREKVQSLLEAIQGCALQRDYVMDLD